MNELFEGWVEDPPTHMLIQAIVSGFGGKSRRAAPSSTTDEIPENEISDSTLVKLSVAAAGALPVRRGKDPGLPKQAPVFDLESMREKNADVLIRRAEARLRNRG